MGGLFDKFKQGLRRTTPTFYKAFGVVGGLFGGRKLAQEDIDTLEEALYGADIGVETATEVLTGFARPTAGKDLRGRMPPHRRGVAPRSGRVEGGLAPRLPSGGHRPDRVNGSGKTSPRQSSARCSRIRAGGDRGPATLSASRQRGCL
jgi:hypothetical protein